MKHNFIVMLFFIFISFLYGCKQVEYVPVETVRIDTLIKTKIEKENIYVKDSSSTEIKGDTVLIEKWHIRWKDREVRDTLYKSKIDSVPKPYPVPEYIEKNIAWWQKTLMYLGGVGVLILLGFIIHKYKIWKLLF